MWYDRRVEKIKMWIRLHKKEVVFSTILFMASSLSFATGYLVNREFNHAAIIIEQCSRAANSAK